MKKISFMCICLLFLGASVFASGDGELISSDILSEKLMGMSQERIRGIIGYETQTVTEGGMRVATYSNGFYLNGEPVVCTITFGTSGSEKFVAALDCGTDADMYAQYSAIRKRLKSYFGSATSEEGDDFINFTKNGQLHILQRFQPRKQVYFIIKKAPQSSGSSDDDASLEDFLAAMWFLSLL